MGTRSVVAIVGPRWLTSGCLAWDIDASDGFVTKLLIGAFLSFLKLSVFFQEQLLESESGLTELECGTVLSFGDGIANIFG